MKKLLCVLISTFILASSALCFSITSFANSNLCQTFNEEISNYVDDLYGHLEDVPNSFNDNFIAYRTFMEMPRNNFEKEDLETGVKYTISYKNYEDSAKKLFGSTFDLKAATDYYFYNFKYDEETDVFAINQLTAGGGGIPDNFFYVVGYNSAGGSYNVYLNRLKGRQNSKDALKSYLTENNITFDESKYIVTNKGVHSHKSNVYAKVEVSYSGNEVKFISISPISNAPEGLISWPEVKPEEPSSSENSSEDASSDSVSSEEVSSDNTSSEDTSSGSPSSEPENNSSNIDSSKNETPSSSKPVKDPENNTSSSKPSGSIPSLTPSGVGSILAITDTAIIEAEEGVFPEDVVVTVTPLNSGEDYETAKTALSTVASKFTLYDITATFENTAIQPNGIVTATFVIPEGYNSSRLSVVYISDGGEITILPCTVDNVSATITADLPHFSKYAVIETIEPTAPDNSSGILSVIWIIPVVLLVILLIATAIWYFLYFKKKTIIYEGPKAEVTNEEETI